MDNVLSKLIEEEVADGPDYWLSYFIRQASNSLVLNPGSGDGSPFTNVFYKNGARVISLDYNLRYLKDNPHVKIQANALNIPFKDDTFDFVISESLILATLRNDENVDRFISEVRRVLKPGAYYLGSEYQVELGNLKAQGFIDVKAHDFHNVSARKP